MYIGICKPKQMTGGDNKGSSDNLISYLTKEEITEDGELEESEGFFNQEGDFIKAEDAKKLIDDNSVGLKKEDSKFFMLTVNPSEKEIKWILKDVTAENPREIKDIKELSPEELKDYHQRLKEYSNEVMNLYAEQFDRTVDGKKIIGEDLVYVAKIEESREYKITDKQVQDNNKLFHQIRVADELTKKELETKLHRTAEGTIIESGLKKEGLQSHVHIVVSRFDKSKKTKMSPLANSRGYSDQHQVGGRKIKVGFSRLEFSLNCEQKFDEKFNYQRNYYERESYKVQQKRNQNQKKGNIINTIDKYGHIDPINSLQFAGRTLQNGVNTRNLSPVNIAKNEINKLNPINEFRYKMDLIKQAQQQIKQVIKSGGLEL
jgi:hypothetical protein